MSDMKCPICGGKMIGNIGSPICHYNQDCPIHDRSVPQEIYDLLERTHKALEKAKSVLTSLHDYARLDGFQECDVEEALAEITALEQKGEEND